jgi:hypothetical protein
MAIKRCSLCDRTEKTHKISSVGICSTCDVALIYWNSKTTTQKVKRARQLDSFQNRMEITLGNVRTTKRRSRRSA